MQTFARKVVSRWLLLLGICLAGWSVQAEPTAESVPAIVTVDWLASALDSDRLLLIDLRSEEAFAAGHVRGAVNIPYLQLFDDTFGMPRLEILRELFSQSGIGHDQHVVAMDGGDFIWAARLYWMLETLGHRQVSLLNVGFGHWQEGELPITDQALPPQRREFVPMIDHSRLQTKLGTLVSIGKRTIIDGRSSEHYLGEASTAKRFGHIPTALNFPCTQNFEATDQGNRMHELENLRSLYSELPRDEEIILYCDGGAEAALNYVVMQALGYQVSVYEASWLEWGNDPVLPIVNPSDRDSE